ncbi:alpha/beta hydrolase family protein [Alcanivorax hongdengensis A-11-3]|uniref:Alpha/beta hydrolase family protein n=1 Tax=Alcanivorax hongdengensis A-11-3 TaxID=1177179 RepID=L0WJL2_9GAMM|nr:alpha/beta fold hydrolase [Alcanivorax hongdengensis]EKF76025.1 alpha/beta hydrolase family protein [Alcanivorax hongdengensis A-11-3]
MPEFSSPLFGGRRIETSPSRVIIVPGLHGSEPQHWQSHWQNSLNHVSRIEVGDWETADLGCWRAGLVAALQAEPTPAVLVAHSFGCLASAAVAADYPGRVSALFLAAPADPAKFGVSHALRPLPLSIRGLLISSNTDPWISVFQAYCLARRLRTDYHNVGDRGHINVAAGVGNWLEGRWLFEDFLYQSGLWVDWAEPPYATLCHL